MPVKKPGRILLRCIACGKKLNEFGKEASDVKDVYWGPPLEDYGIRCRACWEEETGLKAGKSPPRNYPPKEEECTPT